jgi:iron complex outermembrane receptor protein
MNKLVRTNFARKLIPQLAAIPLAIASTISIPALAQSQLVLEEVIVTARKRAESLQESPVAVSAFSAAKLAAAGASTLADLNQLVPNIEVQNGNGTGGVANIYIRGVGQRNTEPNLDSGVGIYIDGVYLSRADGALLDVNDLQSVQVLRGPQGTLFGKNTTGGALVFNTNRPSEVFEGSAGVKVGNYGTNDANLAVNVPINDRWMTRLSMVSKKSDGYIKNEIDGDDYVDADRLSAIWQLRWLPSDELTLDLNANWSKTAQKARPQKCKVLNPAGGWQSQLFDILYITPDTGRTYVDFCRDGENAGDGDPRTVQSDIGGDYNAETKGLSFTADWELNDELSLKSITAWRNTEAAQDDELDHTAVAFLHRTQNVHPSRGGRDTDQLSQEFQLTGEALDGSVQYVSGLYYFEEQTNASSTVTNIGPYNTAIVGFGFRGDSNIASTDNKSAAAYTEIDWDFTESWRLTLGARYTWETREYKEIELLVDGNSLSTGSDLVTELSPGAGLWFVGADFSFNPNYGFTQGGTIEGDVSNTDFSPKASIQYIFDGEGFINSGSTYFTYSEGFRSGGLSEAATGDIEEFDPETVTNLELGLKLDLLENRLRVNIAAFHMSYQDQQFTTVVINPDTGNPSGATINVDESTIQGIELETTFLPIENLELTLNASFNDGKFDEFTDTQLTSGTPGVVPEGCMQSDLTAVVVDACEIDRSDENMVRLPDKSVFLAAQYQFLTPIGAIIPRLQASWKYGVEYCFDASSCASDLWYADKQYNVDARLTWIPDDQWMVAFYGTNLTNEDYIIGGTALADTSGVGGIVFNPPKMYGAELVFNW